jgi:hypothetical protein
MVEGPYPITRGIKDLALKDPETEPENEVQLVVPNVSDVSERETLCVAPD